MSCWDRLHTRKYENTTCEMSSSHATAVRLRRYIHVKPPFGQTGGKPKPNVESLIFYPGTSFRVGLFECLPFFPTAPLSLLISEKISLQYSRLLNIFLLPLHCFVATHQSGTVKCHDKMNACCMYARTSLQLSH